MNKHLADTYGVNDPQVDLENPAEGFVTGTGNGGVARSKLYLSMVNIKEETLKNLPNQVRNDARLTVTYENPPVFLNFLILMTATHIDYTNALSVLSRAIRFFQLKNVLTQDKVAPESTPAASVPIHPLDQLESFTLIFDLYSPAMEEVNHLWGTLGGKQYPFVLHMQRMLDSNSKRCKVKVD